MPDKPTIPCFVEDDAHRAVLESLWNRIRKEEGFAALRLDVRIGGGYGPVQTSLKKFLRDLSGMPGVASPFMIVMIDGNCHGPAERKREMLDIADKLGVANDHLVFGVPDPHIERWLLDQSALQTVVRADIRVDAPEYKCERDLYKRRLREALNGVGISPLAGGVEYAATIMQHVDLMKPGCGDSQIPEFADGLRRLCRRLA